MAIEANGNMMIELGINVKFCIKLRKTAAETLQMLRDVYGDSLCPGQDFLNDTRDLWRKDVEVDPRSGRH